jgi:putative membrane protein
VPGFLGTRGSLILDLVFTAMFLVVPVMWISIWLVYKGRRFRIHKAVQTTIAIVLLITVTAFELEIRIHGWRHLAAESPFWRDGSWNDLIDYWLVVHLLFAIPTPFIWAVVIVRAWRGFPRPPQPSEHSQAHRLWGKIAAAGMTLTAVTGGIFYWLAFAAK